FFLVFGSRVKGYATSDTDLDVAMMIRPEARLEQREQMMQLLFEQIPNLKMIDKILEFWVEKKQNSFGLKVKNESIPTMVGAPQIHFILGSAIVGDTHISNSILSDL